VLFSHLMWLVISWNRINRQTANTSYENVSKFKYWPIKTACMKTLKSLKWGQWLLHFLSHRFLSTNIKITFYTTVFQPVVSHGCETWSATPTYEQLWGIHTARKMWPRTPPTQDMHVFPLFVCVVSKRHKPWAEVIIRPRSPTDVYKKDL
jgi:hypothetical protein